jgi:hypothetical protein
VRRVLLAPLLLAACALPPRVDDRTTPLGAYETFRGALARSEHDRAYALLSDRLRRKLGISSRAEFKDGMILIGESNVAVQALKRSKAEGPAEALPDGRALLPVRVRYLVFGRDLQLWLRPVPVVRVYAEGIPEPVFYQHLPDFKVAEERGVVGLRLAPDLVAALEEELVGKRARRLEWGIEWFLDDFAVGRKPPAQKGAGTAREQGA